MWSGFFSIRELKTVFKQCLRRYSKEMTLKARLKAVGALHNYLRSEMARIFPFNKLYALMNSCSSIPTDANTLFLHSRCFLMNLKMAFAKFLIMFLD